MRLNKYLALHTDLSRRGADQAVSDRRVMIGDQLAQLGQTVSDSDKVYLDQRLITPDTTAKTIILNKPVGYVCSRNGQGSMTVYDLIPTTLHNLNSVGRLDKDSSGLLLMTNDGNLANKLTHPSFEKQKVYRVTLNKPLRADDHKKIEQGIQLEDGTSRLAIKKLSYDTYEITMHEGRNRQIRRTFEELRYFVRELERTQFGPYKLGELKSGKWIAS